MSKTAQNQKEIKLTAFLLRTDQAIKDLTIIRTQLIRYANDPAKVRSLAKKIEDIL